MATATTTDHKTPWLRKVLNGPYHYSPTHRLLEIMALAGYFAISIIYLMRALSIAPELPAKLAWFLFLKSILVAYLAADFVSGFVHWLGDTFGEEHWPVLGAGFIKPFRDHHVDPKDICRHDFIEVNGNNCFVLLMLILPLYFIIPDGWGAWSFFAFSFVVFFAFGIFMTNQFHQWAHMDNPSPTIARLQRWSLILSPSNHNVHHAAPYKTYYCITSGWMNPILDKIRLWRVLERGMSRLTGNDYSGHVKKKIVRDTSKAT